MQLAENHADGRERTRYHKSIPAFQSPGAREFHVHRNDSGAGFLRDKDDALIRLIDGTARTVWCDQNVHAGSERVGQLTQSNHGFARGRAADGAVTGAFDENGDQVAIAARADQADTAPAWETSIKNRRQHQKAVVPNGEDKWLVSRRSDDAPGVFYLESQRARPNSKYSETNLDQDAPGPAFDFQWMINYFELSSFQR